MALRELPSFPPEVSSDSYHHTATTRAVSELPSSCITGHNLDGSNFLQWSSSVRLFIRGRGRYRHLIGELTPPPASDANAQTWEIEDSMVMSWRITSVTPEIGENFILYETAHEIWKAAQELYSSKQNTSAIFEIESTFHDLRQGELSVTQYYSILSRNWQQMDAFEERHWNCPEKTKNFKVFVEEKRVFKFLLGLNKNLDVIRGRVLSTKPLSSIREVFSEVRREESRRKIMMGENDQPHQTENSSAFTTRAIDSRTKKTRPWCDHCRKLWHTRERCWKLHGKPSGWKSPSGEWNMSKAETSNKLRGNHVTAEEVIFDEMGKEPFTPE
ncbi:uncharacterized protein LOC110821962 isoform X1 [Carica papaya]|uniref:uncharacterized protein LOC110821962 isoform X1 n=1 Tax=Carica papaya TaxID=3649 RepID=UPI000B8CD4DF|nr:uncharacterized protein LOC110821962 isoform X1 [Carica papaya]